MSKRKNEKETTESLFDRKLRHQIETKLIGDNMVYFGVIVMFALAVSRGGMFGTF